MLQAFSTKNCQTFNSKKISEMCSIIYFTSYLKWIIWKLFSFKQYELFVPHSRILSLQKWWSLIVKYIAASIFHYLVWWFFANSDSWSLSSEKTSGFTVSIVEINIFWKRNFSSATFFVENISSVTMKHSNCAV